MRVLVVVVLAVLASGCTRAFYRRQADRDTYQVIEERNQDPRWAVPRISVDTPPESRLHDPFNPDRPPMPPDDPAADRYMQRVFGMRGYRHWHRDGDAPWIEDPSWRDYLELDQDGKLVLTPEKSVSVGLLNSRNYQTQLESLYLSALTVTLDRFQFQLQWFGTNDTNFTHFGSSADELNTLTTSSTLGFTRALATGGQIMAELANSFVFQYAGPDSTIAFSNIIINFTQPLLQNAGRAVALETLTEAERTLLYGVRDFAHYRKQFTFQVATNNYLNLLSQEQSVRNQQANVKTLEENLRLHQALYTETGKVSQVKVAQVDLSLQQALAALVQAETSLETAQDGYKLLLGLPPDFPIRLDDSLLAPFQLSDPKLTDLQSEIEQFRLRQRQVIQATLADLRAGFKKLETFHARTVTLADEVNGEIGRLQKQLEQPEGDKGQQARSRANLAELILKIGGVGDELRDLKKKTAQAVAGLAQFKGMEGAEALVRLTASLESIASDLFVIQNRVRVYLIRLQPVDYGLADATEYALSNRLDLMNQDAQVVDAWRQITVTASALKAGLNLLASANIASPPLGDRPFDFRASASAYSVGFHLDTPLNRMAQRNAYRASLISYQQARRAYMALEDSIRESIRDDLRQLRLNRINFEIARQSLVSAALQYQSSREELLMPNADPTSTLNILNALNGLLAAKNTLISSWVSYETTRYRLLLDMEALQVDERGFYTDGHDNRTEPAASTGSDLSAPQALPDLP
jgi:outer membrane protein TolC